MIEFIELPNFVCQLTMLLDTVCSYTTLIIEQIPPLVFSNFAHSDLPL